MDYVIKETHEFKKQFLKLAKNIRKRFKRQFFKLKKDPFSIGDPLKGRNWFREIKNEKFRVYYVISEKQVFVLLVSVSQKKDQQNSIDTIFE